MTMFANSCMTVTIEDAIKGMEELLAMASAANRKLAVAAYTKRLEKLRGQTTAEFRAEMGLSAV